VVIVDISSKIDIDVSICVGISDNIDTNIFIESEQAIFSAACVCVCRDAF
jgi:hypothetical protein